MEHVGVGEQEPVAVGVRHALPAGPRLADPPLGQRGARHDAHARIAAGRRGRRGKRVVVGLVVNHHHLDARVVERAQAADRRADPARLVARGHHDAHAGPVAGRRLGGGAVGRVPLVTGEGRGAGPQRGGDPGGEEEEVVAHRPRLVKTRHAGPVSVAGIILAAGRGARMGRPKQLAVEVGGAPPEDIDTPQDLARLLARRATPPAG